MQTLRRFPSLVLMGLLFATPSISAEQTPATPQEPVMPDAIHENTTVQLEYTLTSEGKVVDSTQGREPFRYVHGKGQIIPGLERQLAGLHVGDTKDITVEPNEAYGPVDPAAVIEVPKEQLPPNVTPEVGMVLRGADPHGREFRATVQDIKPKSVTLNLNHPLAGKTLLFHVKVLEIAPAR